MNSSLISVRYAKALFLLSKEKGEVDNVYKDINMLFQYCAEAKEFRQLLMSPIMTPAKKKKALKAVFEKHANQLTINFLGIMIDNRREALLADIARNFIDYYKEEKDLKSVMLYTAVQLDEDYLLSIKDLLQEELGAKIEMNVRVRDNLLGGFVLMVDGKMMDATVASKLKEIKKKLLS